MKNLSKMILVLVAAFPLGAAAKKPVDLTVLRQSGYQTLIATTDQTPRMTLASEVWSLSPASVLGIVAFVDAKQKADKVRAEYDVRDPAQYIAAALGRETAAALGITSSDQPSGLESSFSSVHLTLRSAKELAATYGTGALVINVGTQNWFADTVGKDRYRVSYWAKAQVVDTNTRTVLASKECQAPLKKRDVAPELSAMLAGDAESLKFELHEAANYCLDVFRKGLFSGAAQPQ
ncbi:hypothetical protein WCE37_14675 [Luteimonas sp. MJ250]|uniref:hypothetical protein n=1 Tax=Luteimonas sp. MJ250 TaxID=3129236 RepID=UPI0031BB2606